MYLYFVSIGTAKLITNYALSITHYSIAAVSSSSAAVGFSQRKKYA